VRSTVWPWPPECTELMLKYSRKLEWLWMLKLRHDLTHTIVSFNLFLPFPRPFSSRRFPHADHHDLSDDLPYKQVNLPVLPVLPVPRHSSVLYVASPSVNMAVKTRFSLQQWREVPRPSRPNVLPSPGRRPTTCPTSVGSRWSSSPRSSPPWTSPPGRRWSGRRTSGSSASSSSR
jgi:hypothetical protein